MAATKNINVLRGVMRTFNLLEKPGEFMKDWRIVLTTFRYMLAGRKHNADARKVSGPSRDEMLKIVEDFRASQQDKAA